MPSSPPSRFAGLDGLRAVAVLLVVVYHLLPSLGIAGGFIGVDVFFVISGFLITSLLLRERASTGTVALGRFWQRRARRLLPPLLLVVTVCASVAWLIGGDVLVGVGRQVLGAATFSYNWIALAAGSDYFSAGEPELFRNLWSLAVEEQFYLLWPLVLPLFLLLPRRWMRAGAAGLLAAASAGWAVVLIGGFGWFGSGAGASGGAGAVGSGVTRVYYGTDTHAFGLLIGVALAFALQGVFARAVGSGAGAAATTAAGSAASAAAAEPTARGVGAAAAASNPTATGSANPAAGAASPTGFRIPPVAGLMLGLLALAGLIALGIITPGTGAETFPGVLVVASVLTCLVILLAVVPGSRLGPALDVAPLRWIGERSYGIYLWHWPVLVLLLAAGTGSTTDAGIPLPLGLLALALTFAAAALSYRFLEQPVRRLGVRGVFRGVRRALASTPLRRFGAVVTLATGALVVGGTTAAVAVAPPVSSSQAVVQAGQDALDAAVPASEAEVTVPLAIDPGPQPTAAACPSRALPEPQLRGLGAACPPGADGSPVRAVPASVSGDRITAVGDSVMLASAGGLLDARPGIQIDAEVSRSIWAGPKILRALADRGALRDYVVVGLGTNGPIDADVLSDIYGIVGRDRTLVLVTAFAPRDWIAGVNDELQEFAHSHPGVVVADWARAIEGHTDLLAGDRIHPGPTGGRVFADAVGAAVDGVENQRSEAAYQVARMQWAAKQAFGIVD